MPSQVEKSQERIPIVLTKREIPPKRSPSLLSPKRLDIFKRIGGSFRRRGRIEKNPTCSKNSLDKKSVSIQSGEIFDNSVFSELHLITEGSFETKRPQESIPKKMPLSAAAVALEAKLDAKKGAAAAASSKQEKIFKLQAHRDWVIENYRNHKEPLKIEDPKMNQNVCVRESDGINIHVSKKVNNIILEKCSNIAIVVENVISAIEIIRCQNVKLEVIGTASALVLDNSDNVNMYVSLKSKGIQITSSQISEANLHFPESEQNDDEWIEVPIPAQFIHHLVPQSNSLVTKVSDLYR